MQRHRGACRTEDGGDCYPVKTVYYESESDEFSSAVIETKTVDESYKFLRRGALYAVARFFAYRMVATPIAYIFCKIKLALKIRNRHVLEESSGEGCFIFANHTQETADAFIPSIAAFPKSVYTVVHPNNVSMPVLGRITPYLGAIPIPTARRAMRAFSDAVEHRLLEGCAVVIYPEAHIWPYYSGIRDFPDTSMTYPVRYNCPSYTMTTVYKKRKGKRPPRAVTYLDGPFYPDMSVAPRERARELRDRIYNTMKARSKESDCEYIRYLPKKDRKENGEECKK